MISLIPRINIAGSNGGVCEELFFQTMDANDFTSWLSILQQVAVNSMILASPLSQQTSWRKKWKERYFVLVGDVLLWYDSETSAYAPGGGKQLGSISLTLNSRTCARITYAPKNYSSELVPKYDFVSNSTDLPDYKRLVLIEGWATELAALTVEDAALTELGDSGLGDDADGLDNYADFVSALDIAGSTFKSSSPSFVGDDEDRSYVPGQNLEKVTIGNLLATVPSNIESWKKIYSGSIAPSLFPPSVVTFIDPSTFEYSSPSVKATTLLLLAPTVEIAETWADACQKAAETGGLVPITTRIDGLGTPSEQSNEAQQGSSFAPPEETSSQSHPAFQNGPLACLSIEIPGGAVSSDASNELQMDPESMTSIEPNPVILNDDGQPSLLNLELKSSIYAKQSDGEKPTSSTAETMSPLGSPTQSLDNTSPHELDGLDDTSGPAGFINDTIGSLDSTVVYDAIEDSISNSRLTSDQHIEPHISLGQKGEVIATVSLTPERTVDNVSPKIDRKSLLTIMHEEMNKLESILHSRQSLEKKHELVGNAATTESNQLEEIYLDNDASSSNVQTAESDIISTASDIQFPGTVTRSPELQVAPDSTSSDDVQGESTLLPVQRTIVVTEVPNDSSMNASSTSIVPDVWFAQENGVERITMRKRIQLFLKRRLGDELGENDLTYIEDEVAPDLERILYENCQRNKQSYLDPDTIRARLRDALDERNRRLEEKRVNNNIDPLVVIPAPVVAVQIPSEDKGRLSEVPPDVAEQHPLKPSAPQTPIQGDNDSDSYDSSSDSSSDYQYLKTVKTFSSPVSSPVGLTAKHPVINQTQVHSVGTSPLARAPSSRSNQSDAGKSVPRWGMVPHPGVAPIRHYPTQVIDGDVLGKRRSMYSDELSSMHISLVLERRPESPCHLPTLNKWQSRACADCGITQTTGMFGEKAHYCWYTELLFCQKCMMQGPLLAQRAKERKAEGRTVQSTSRTAICMRALPWRIVQELDDTLYPVSRAAALFLDSIWEKPIIALTACAPYTLTNSPGLQKITAMRGRIADLKERIATSAAAADGVSLAALGSDLNGPFVFSPNVGSSRALLGLQESDTTDTDTQKELRSPNALPSEAPPPLVTATSASRSAASAVNMAGGIIKRTLGPKLSFLGEIPELLPLFLIVPMASPEGSRKIVARLNDTIRRLESLAMRLEANVRLKARANAPSISLPPPPSEVNQLPSDSEVTKLAVKGDGSPAKFRPTRDRSCSKVRFQETAQLVEFEKIEPMARFAEMESDSEGNSSSNSDDDDDDDSDVLY